MDIFVDSLPTGSRLLSTQDPEYPDGAMDILFFLCLKDSGQGVIEMLNLHRKIHPYWIT